MTVKTGQQWSGLVVCKDSTGALSAPSAGPAGVLYVDGTANGAGVTITGANPYKWTVTLPALTAGQCVSMYITATIATIATASVVAEDVADTALNSDAVTLAATQPAIAWGAQTITNNAGAALTLSSTGGNGAGLVVSGNGSGAGVDIDGGATGIGVDVDAAANMGVSIAGNITGLVGALDIRNAHADGNGMHVETASTSTARGGLYSHGGVGQFNFGHAIGQENNSGSGAYGQYNYGNVGIVAESTNSYAVQFTGPIGLRIDSWTGGGIEIQSENAGPALLIEHYGADDGDAVSFVTNHGDGLQVVGTTADINADLSGSVGSVTSYGTLVADIWSYTTRTLTSLSALVASVAAAVWAYATRTLTSTAASTTAAVSGSTLTITNATTYSATLTGLTIPADWLDMWFTVKDDESRADSAAIIQIHKSNPADATNDGLVYLNGAAGTKADGSLTIDQAAGTVAIRIEATATDDLARQSAIGYDVKVQSTAAGLTLLTAGTCNVELTETRTID